MHREEIKKKIETVRSYLDELKPLLVPAGTIIIQDKVKVRAIERLFQLVVDEAIDTNMLIIGDSAIASPESYRSTFYGLSELKVLDRNFVDRISESAKLRNQIVHEYEKVQELNMVEAIKKFSFMYEEYLTTIIKTIFA